PHSNFVTTRHSPDGAEEANAALKLGDRDFQLVMLNIFWRSAPLTPNPVKQASLVVAMLRQLKKDNKLEPEHARWLSEAEAKLIQLRQHSQELIAQAN